MNASFVYGSDLVAKGAGIFGEATLARRNDRLHQPLLLSAPDRGERNDSYGKRVLIGDGSRYDHARSGFGNLSSERRIEDNPDNRPSHHEGQFSLSRWAKSLATLREGTALSLYSLARRASSSCKLCWRTQAARHWLSMPLKVFSEENFFALDTSSSLRTTVVLIRPSFEYYKSYRIHIM